MSNKKSLTDLVNFLNEIKEERGGPGMTLGNIKKRVDRQFEDGISTSEISRILSGERKRIPSETIEKLAVGFKVPYLKLMSVAGYLPESLAKKIAEYEQQPTIDGQAISEKEIEIIRAVREPEESIPHKRRSQPKTENDGDAEVSSTKNTSEVRI